METEATIETDPDPEPSEQFLELPDGRIHYLDWGGDGLPAHFLHGNGFCAGTYTPFIRYLVDDLHILASDVRGHGGSDQLRALPADGKTARKRQPYFKFCRSKNKIDLKFLQSKFANLFNA